MSKQVDIPTMIDEPETILFWQSDEFLVASIIFVMGFIVKQVIISIVIAYVLTKFLRKYKDVRPDGFMFHWLYWVGIATKKGHTIRNSFIKTYRN